MTLCLTRSLSCCWAPTSLAGCVPETAVAAYSDPVAVARPSVGDRGLRCRRIPPPTVDVNRPPAFEATDHFGRDTVLLGGCAIPSPSAGCRRLVAYCGGGKERDASSANTGAGFGTSAAGNWRESTETNGLMADRRDVFSEPGLPR